MRNQAPLHEPTLVTACLSDDDGNLGGSLRGDVKARRVFRQVAVEVPANPYVTKLDGTGDAATHIYSVSFVPDW